MSNSNNYYCHNCGRYNSNGNLCNQCQSEFLEEIPSNDQQIPLINQFQNLFNNDFNLQTFTNMLLPMLMSQIPQFRSQRRTRAPRRIKRITHSRSYPTAFQSLQIPLSEIRLININGLNSQLLIFDPNDDIFTQLLNEDTEILPITRNDINQLPTLTMTPSNLQVNPSCAICLENFDSSSEVKQLPTCHHIFHTNCLTEWLLRHGNCPMCRTTIPTNQPRPSPSVFNNQWFQQLLNQTFGQPNPPQLPHFDSQTDSTSNSN